MVIAVDLGCYDHGHGDRHDSVAALIEKYRPGILFGFDIHPDLEEGEYLVGGCEVHIERAAAWTHDGEISAFVDGTRTRVAGDGVPCRCFDFAAWLGDWRRPGDELIVKMDIEGAEYELLPWLAEHGADALIDELLIEWHSPQRIATRCRQTEWWM